MNISSTVIPDVLVIEPDVYEDHRGFFFESYNKDSFEKNTGVKSNFVQDNHSMSSQGVLRGLHYQVIKPQGKLVRVISGEVFDVAVDLRRSSATFGQWAATLLSEANRKQLWIPAGFAHGFIALSSTAELLYKTTDYYAPEFERCIKWDDDELAIDWQYDGKPIVSEKDEQGVPFSTAELFE